MVKVRMVVEVKVTVRIRPKGSADILGSVDMKTHLPPTVEVLQNCLNEVRSRGAVSVKVRVSVGVNIRAMVKVKASVRVRVRGYCQRIFWGRST